MVIGTPILGPFDDPGQDMHHVHVGPVDDPNVADDPISRIPVREGSVVSDEFGPPVAGPSTLN